MADRSHLITPSGEIHRSSILSHVFGTRAKKRKLPASSVIHVMPNPRIVPSAQLFSFARVIPLVTTEYFTIPLASCVAEQMWPGSGPTALKCTDRPVVKQYVVIFGYYLVGLPVSGGIAANCAQLPGT